MILDIYITGIDDGISYRALKGCNWVMSRAARKLGITERMIGYKMKKYNIRKGEVVKESRQ